MVEQTVASSREAQTNPQQEGTRAQERYAIPPVDIYDTPDGLVLLADLPGVNREDLDVRIDNNRLTIQAPARHAVAGEPIQREYELGYFFRQFELSDEVDQGKLAAQLKHGVLTLYLPRIETAKPRQIAVHVS